VNYNQRLRCVHGGFHSLSAHIYAKPNKCSQINQDMQNTSTNKVSIQKTDKKPSQIPSTPIIYTDTTTLLFIIIQFLKPPFFNRHLNRILNINHPGFLQPIPRPQISPRPSDNLLSQPPQIREVEAVEM